MNADRNRASSRRTSLARRFLVSAGAVSVVLMLATTIVAFLSFKISLEHRHAAALDQYISERAMREDRQFTTLAALQRSALASLKVRRDHLKDAEAERLFNAYFTPRKDGTRRTDDALFDGRTEANGDYLYGIAGFIPHPGSLNLNSKKTLVAALQVVSRFGESVGAFYDNIYFFTPQAQLVMFGPTRPDKLKFYRSTAPSSLDISGYEMARFATVSENPQRVSRCTSLQHLVSDAASARTGVSCITPFDLGGHHVGTFGSSLELGGYFRRATANAPPGSTAMIIGADGRLIAHPAIGGPRPVSETRVFSIERSFSLPALTAAIRAHGGDHGVVRTSDSHNIVAYGRLKGPDWYYLIASPASAIAWDAARSAAWVLALGLAAAALQTAAVVFVARRIVVAPVELLARSAASERDARGTGRAAGALQSRSDEIGMLARELQTERETVDAVLGSLEARVEDRTAELQVALQEKSRFLANMSHELRTPLNGIIAVSDVLLRRTAAPGDRDLLQLIATSGLVLEQVLSDILDTSKLEAGHVRLETLAFDLRALVGQAGDLHRAAAETKGLFLKVTVGTDVSTFYSGDPLRLTQILTNLLSNAVKFTGDGGVTLSVTAQPGGLKFEITDTGVGFSPETAERLFSPFEQADPTITRRFGGTGLGLSISRSLVELMGGTIRAAPNAEGGAHFEFDLPLTKAQAPPPLAKAEAPTLTFHGVRVLLAEDHPTNQRIVQLILEMAGMTLHIVPNGGLAVEAMASSRFDLVLMDMQMPVMDGLTATRAIRELEREAGPVRTPIIMLTADAMREHVDMARDAGADLFLAKPFRPDELISAVTRALASHEGGTSEARDRPGAEVSP